MNENFASFKVSRGSTVEMAKAKGIPGVDDVSNLLPDIAKQCVKIFNGAIKAYQTIKAKNGIARVADLCVGITGFEAISDQVALELAVTHRSRILEAHEHNTGILGVWNKAAKAKDAVLVNNYNTPEKKLAMQDGLLLLSTMKSGCFDAKQDLSMQFVAFIADARVSAAIEDSVATAAKKSGKGCIVMCVTDTVYDNPVLNNKELLKDIGLKNLHVVLDATDDKPELANSQ